MHWILVVMTIFYNGQHQSSYYRFKTKDDCIAAKAAIESLADAGSARQDKRNQIKAQCFINDLDTD